MKEAHHSQTRQLLSGAKRIARAYRQSIKSDNLPVRLLKTAEMAISLPILTAMSLPVSVVKDVTKPDSIYGGLMRKMITDVKQVYKTGSFPEKIDFTLGALAYTAIALTFLPLSIAVDTSK